MGKKTRVLIVEDEAMTAMDLHDTLISLGYEVVGTSATGEKAVDIALNMVPDLVLMDICLAGEMDGISAAEEIRVKSDIPVIYTTAFSDEDFLKRASITEPYSYIIKPYNYRELHSNMEIALYRHRIKKSCIWLLLRLKESMNHIDILKVVLMI